MKKFLLVDDHVVVRAGIKLLLSQIFKPCEVHEAGDGDSAIEKIKLEPFDLILMDIQMPNTDTLGIMEYIQIKFPDTKVLIFSMSAENIYAKRFLRAGAKGFVSKDSSLNEITKAINIVLDNRNYISTKLADILVGESFSNKITNPFDQLSNRELEIVSLLLSGQGVSEISRSLNLQVSTIATHKARLFEKLNITNILELKELATFYNL